MAAAGLQLAAGQVGGLEAGGGRASGGIGSTAVQLAAARGARVIGAAGAANQNYLSLLGAKPVTYGEGMAERIRALAPGGVDAALDVAGNGVLPLLIDLAGGPQNVVTLADFDGAKEHGVHFSNGFSDGHASAHSPRWGS